MKAVISIAARMASTRLPGKVMAEVAGKPILQHLVERLSRANAEVVIANNGCDPEIRDLAAWLGVRYIGEPVDVMSIHQWALHDARADMLCIAGADDPLLDPELFDFVITRLLVRGSRDRVHYVKTAGWPLGMNVWGVTSDAMNDAADLARAPDERQHVVPFWERRPNTYPQAVIRRPGEDLYGRLRLTVDNPSDLELVREVYDALSATLARGVAVADRVIDYLLSQPFLARINADGLQGTAARDAIYPDLTPVDGPDEPWQPYEATVERAALADVRRHVQTERQAALAAVPERGSFAEGQAAALLSMDQWLQYKGDL